MPHAVRVPRPIAAIVVLLALAAPRAHAGFAGGIITLAVDASEAPRKILHSRMAIPVEPGPLTLVYPKWIPGEHGPTGPLADVAGLRILAGGKPLVWKRDLLDMHAVTCVVPEGVRAVEVAFDFISAASPEGFSSAASCTENLMILSWNQVLLAPAGRRADDLTYSASLRLPAGWRAGTALPLQRESGDRLQFAPASLATIVDSPVLAGRYFRRVDLSPGASPRHLLDMAADSPEALAISDDQIAKHRQLVNESFALFGTRHYREYRFLLSMSEHIAHFGLEHHESSDNRVRERIWLDDDLRARHSGLLAHEIVHSWNGKFRRPAGLATPDFQQPFRTDLLWVYEGLTQYLGFVLAGRSGVRTPEQTRQNLALLAAVLDERPGRTWRPLRDTADEAQILFEASSLWESWRRATDFYDEGLLIWLEADVLIRRQTQGRRSLDDFCRRFFGGPDGAPRVLPYDLDDIVRTLNEVAPHDWRAFFGERLESLAPRAPLGGIEQGGWRIAYADSVPAFLKALESSRGYVDLRFSIGIRVATDGGRITDVIPGTAAAKAGLAPGLTLLAVNGRKWSKELLRQAVRATRSRGETLELIAENGDFYRTFRLDYRGGERYPHLARDGAKPDLLGAILTPLTPAVPPAPERR